MGIKHCQLLHHYIVEHHVTRDKSYTNLSVGDFNIYSNCFIVNSRTQPVPFSVSCSSKFGKWLLHICLMQECFLRRDGCLAQITNHSQTQNVTLSRWCGSSVSLRVVILPTILTRKQLFISLALVAGKLGILGCSKKAFIHPFLLQMGKICSCKSISSTIPQP